MITQMEYFTLREVQSESNRSRYVECSKRLDILL